MASILSFARRQPASMPLASKLPWQNQDLAELYRVRDRLAASGLAVDVDSGVSDEGDPWFVYQQSGTDNVVVHIARIDTQIHVINCVTDSIYVGSSFREVADRMLEDAPLALGSELKRSSNVVLHPSAFLTAFVAAAVMLVDLIEHNRAEAAETADGTTSAGEGWSLPGSGAASDSGERQNESFSKTDDSDGMPRRMQRDSLVSQSLGNVTPISPAPGHASIPGVSLIDATTGAVGVSLFAVELLRMIHADRSEIADQSGHLSTPDIGKDVSVGSVESQANASVHIDAQQMAVINDIASGTTQPGHDDVGRLVIELPAPNSVPQNAGAAERSGPTANLGGDVVAFKSNVWVSDALSQRGAQTRTEAHEDNTSSAVPYSDAAAGQVKHEAVETLKVSAPVAAPNTTSVPPSNNMAQKPHEATADFSKIILQLLGDDAVTGSKQNLIDSIKSAPIVESLVVDDSKNIAADKIGDLTKISGPEFRAGITDILNYTPGDNISVHGFVLGEDILAFTDTHEAYKYIENFSIDGNDIVLGNADHGELRLVGVLTDSMLAATEPVAIAS